MSKSRGREIRGRAISELARLSQSLDEAFEITADMPIAEIDEELREMGADPDQLSLSLSRLISEAGGEKSPAYIYVSGESLSDEPAAAEVKRLMLDIRHLSRQFRYGEAFELAERATRLAPDYWRAWRTYGSMLGLMGDVERAEAAYRRVQENFSDDPKAVAAALRGRAGLKEIRCRLNPSGDDLREVLRLYEEALEFDGSHANTRACLLINMVLSRQTDRAESLLEDSRMCEGFLDALVLEIAEREARPYGAKMYKVKQAFPIGFRNLLYGSGSGRFGGPDAGAAY